MCFLSVCIWWAFLSWKIFGAFDFLMCSSVPSERVIDTLLSLLQSFFLWFNRNPAELNYLEGVRFGITLWSQEPYRTLCVCPHVRAPKNITTVRADLQKCKAEQCLHYDDVGFSTKNKNNLLKHCKSRGNLPEAQVLFLQQELADHWARKTCCKMGLNVSKS